jgi:RNA polymerase sigma-70 factor, ECF subfamily
VGIVCVYESLIVPHHDELRRYCSRLAWTVWDAEDVYQETLVCSLGYFRRHDSKI